MLSTIIGLNPALSRVITLQNLEIGEVNRASKVQVVVGGKGQNVLVASSCLRVLEPPTIVQFLGKGAEGDALMCKLETKTSSFISVRTEAPCRVCVTLLHDNTTTEIIEPSDGILSREVDELISIVSARYSTEKARSLAVMGSLPKNCPVDIYTSIIPLVANSDSKILLDTVVGVKDAILTCLKIGCSPIVKINIGELVKLTDFHPSSTKLSNDEISKAGLLLIEEVLGDSSFSLESHVFIALTDGPSQAHMLCVPVHSSQDKVLRHWLYTLPPLPRPLVSPIGAGDATSAGTIFSWAQQVPDLQGVTSGPVDCFKWGLACGSSSCMSESNSTFEFDDAIRIFDSISVIELTKY